jgi:hypothetical protein
MIRSPAHNLRRECLLTAACLSALIFSIAPIKAAEPRVADSSTSSNASATHFEFVDNRVLLPVFVNGEGPFEFILDTGAGDGSSITLDLFNRLHLEKEGKSEVTGAGANTESVLDTHAASLKFGSYELGPIPLMAFSMKAMTDAIGFRELDGILGDALFDRFVVTLDFDQQVITLRNPRDYEPPPGSVVIPFEIYNHIVPACEGLVDGRKARLLIDLGDRSSFTLFKPFWKKYGYQHHRSVIRAMTGIGIGGPIYGLVTRVQTVTIGGADVKQPLTRLVLQKPSAINDHVIDGSVGTGILKKFVVTFDYPHRRMILAPGKERNLLDTYDRSGVWIGRVGAELRILDVTHDSAAQAADIRVGDSIVAIDGVAAGSIFLPDVRARFSDPHTESSDIVVMRAGRQMVKRLTMRDLVPLR